MPLLCPSVWLNARLLQISCWSTRSWEVLRPRATCSSTTPFTEPGESVHSSHPVQLAVCAVVSRWDIIDLAEARFHSFVSYTNSVSQEYIVEKTRHQQSSSFNSSRYAQQRRHTARSVGHIFSDCLGSPPQLGLVSVRASAQQCAPLARPCFAPLVIYYARALWGTTTRRRAGRETSSVLRLICWGGREFDAFIRTSCRCLLFSSCFWSPVEHAPSMYQVSELVSSYSLLMLSHTPRSLHPGK